MGHSVSIPSSLSFLCCSDKALRIDMHSAEIARKLLTVVWMTFGIGLVAAFTMLLALSSRFAYGTPVVHRPTGIMVLVLMAAGLLYLGAVWIMLKNPFGGTAWWGWMLGVGLLLRLLMFSSTPMLKDDYFRYLWDGGLSAHGYNPYRYSPADVIEVNASTSITGMAKSAGNVVERVNHPHLRTIYPYVAQGAFALAHWVAPWRIEGLRLVWFGFDAAAMVLLIALLWRIGIDRANAMIYWWNPLLIKEIYNSAHMDVAILPFLIGALLLVTMARPNWAALVLGFGVGVKLWPVLVFPVLLCKPIRKWRTTLSATVAFGFTAGLAAALFLWTGYDESSGLRAYASRWQMNDSLYLLIHAVAGLFYRDHAQTLARLTVAVLLIAWVTWLTTRPQRSPQQRCEYTLWIVAALFLLSPTQFPWYYTWMLPLLAIHPSPGLLILSFTLPLYYLRFPMRDAGHADYFDYGVVWLQFVPAFVLLGWEAARRWQAAHRVAPEGYHRET